MTEWISDDIMTISELLKSQWSLDISEVPHFYDDWNALARNNSPGSILVSSLGINQTKQGINYDSMRVTHRISLDLQNPVNRERHFKWMNEICRILIRYRRAGECTLKGWDYIDMSSWTMRPGYTSYYHSVLEITLVKEVKGMRCSGFGDESIIPSDICKDINTEEHTEEQR